VKRLSLACVAVLALTLAPSAAADYGMLLRKARVHPGDLVTVWSNGCLDAPTRGMRVYLVPAAAMGFDTVHASRPPVSRAYRYLGRFRCIHVHDPQPLPGGGHWTATFRFRMPKVGPGWFKVAMYCPPCQSVIAATQYWDGKRMHALVWGLLVVRR